MIMVQNFFQGQRFTTNEKDDNRWWRFNNVPRIAILSFRTWGACRSYSLPPFQESGDKNKYWSTHHPPWPLAIALHNPVPAPPEMDFAHRKNSQVLHRPAKDKEHPGSTWLPSLKTYLVETPSPFALFSALWRVLYTKRSRSTRWRPLGMMMVSFFLSWPRIFLFRVKYHKSERDQFYAFVHCLMAAGWMNQQQKSTKSGAGGWLELSSGSPVWTTFNIWLFTPQCFFRCLLYLFRGFLPCSSMPPPEWGAVVQAVSFLIAAAKLLQVGQNLPLYFHRFCFNWIFMLFSVRPFAPTSLRWIVSAGSLSLLMLPLVKYAAPGGLLFETIYKVELYCVDWVSVYFFVLSFERWTVYLQIAGKLKRAREDWKIIQQWNINLVVCLL